MRPDSASRLSADRPSKVAICLVALIMAADICPELRISMNGFHLALDDLGGALSSVHGKPRLVEVAILLLLIWMALAKQIFSMQPQLLVLLTVIIVLTSAARLFHGEQWDQVRSGLLLPFALFMSIYSMCRSASTRTMILTLIASSTFVSAIIVALQPVVDTGLPSITILSNGEAVRRFCGLGQGVAYQSAYLVLGFSVTVSAAMFSIQKGRKLAYLFMVVVLLVAIVLTGARTSYVAILVVVAYLFVFKWKSAIRLAPTFLAATLLFAYFFSTILLHVRTLGIARWDFQDQRIGAWLPAMDVALAHPFLGVSDYSEAALGMGLYTTAHPQNGFLGLALLAGIPVAVGYLLLLGAVYRHRLQLQSQDAGPESYCWGVILVCSMVTYLVFMMTEIIYVSIQVQVLFFTICGCAIGAAREMPGGDMDKETTGNGLVGLVPKEVPLASPYWKNQQHSIRALPSASMPRSKTQRDD